MSAHGWLLCHLLLTIVGLLAYSIGSVALQQRRHPSAAVGWVLLLVFVPWVALPLYLLFGNRKIPKPRAVAWHEPPAASETPLRPWPIRLADSLGLPPAARVEAMRLHRDGGHAREALDTLIASAHTSLDVSTFLLARDPAGRGLCERLVERAGAGVRVRVIVDGVGAIMGGGADLAMLRRGGVEVARFMPPWASTVTGRSNLRNHRKYAVADARRMWCGGRNLAAEYLGGGAKGDWIDLSFDLEGPLVAEAARLFDADWAFATGVSAAAIPRVPLPPESPVGEAAPLAQLIPSGPDHAEDTLHALLVSACFQARQRILAVTPYFVPDETLLLALTLAAHRGVAVDLVVPRRSNHRMADIARNRGLRALARAGARVWLAPGMVHAKAVVVDRSLALAGSANLDSRSLFLNYELMVAFYGEACVAELGDRVEALRQASEPAAVLPSGRWRLLAEGLVLWIAFQL